MLLWHSAMDVFQPSVVRKIYFSCYSLVFWFLNLCFLNQKNISDFSSSAPFLLFFLRKMPSGDMWQLFRLFCNINKNVRQCAKQAFFTVEQISSVFYFYFLIFFVEAQFANFQLWERFCAISTIQAWPSDRSYLQNSVTDWKKSLKAKWRSSFSISEVSTF